jgi:hypothetical protein
MLVAGIGAGILNGETAKVSMTAVPAERAGMAAGVGGTVRFAGVVTGFAALGAILFGRTIASLRQLDPSAPDSRLAAMAQRLATGDVPGATRIGRGAANVALASFGAGYRAIFLTAAAVAATAAVASWLLVKASDTEPERSPAGLEEAVVLSVE